MASKNKFKKARNSYCSNALKFGNDKLKRLYFYTSTQRKHIKNIDMSEVNDKDF